MSPDICPTCSNAMVGVAPDDGDHLLWCDCCGTLEDNGNNMNVPTIYAELLASVEALLSLAEDMDADLKARCGMKSDEPFPGSDDRRTVEAARALVAKARRTPG